MTTDNVTRLNTWGTINKTPEQALKEVQEMNEAEPVRGVLIIGWDKDGFYYSQGSAMTVAEANYLVDKAKESILSCYGEEDPGSERT